jgi:hypothetical protein
MEYGHFIFLSIGFAEESYALCHLTIALPARPTGG